MSHNTSSVKAPVNCQNEERPLILIKRAARGKRPKPQARAWKVSQYVPIVMEGLVSNGTQAVAMLNLSGLPESASAEVCLAWARAFCQAMEGGVDAREAAHAADGPHLPAPSPGEKYHQERG